MLRRKSSCMVLLITIFSVGVFASAYSSGFYEPTDQNKNNTLFINQKYNANQVSLSINDAKGMPHGSEVIVNGVVYTSNGDYTYLADSNTGVGIKVEGLVNQKINDSIEISGKINVNQANKIITIKGGQYIKTLAANMPINSKELDFNKALTPIDVGNVITISNSIYNERIKDSYSFTKEGHSFNLILKDQNALKDEISYLNKFSNGFSEIKMKKIIALVGYNNSQYEIELHLGSKLDINYMQAVIDAMDLSHTVNDGKCKTQFYVAKEYVLSLPSTELNDFKNSSIPNIKKARLRYLEWARILNQDPYNATPSLAKEIIRYDYSGMIIVIISANVMIASGFGLYLLVRKRNKEQ